MQNVWLLYRKVKTKFPLATKVKVVWPFSSYDGHTGIVSDYEHYQYFTTSAKYGMYVEVAIWTHLYGMTFHKLPADNLVPV